MVVATIKKQSAFQLESSADIYIHNVGWQSRWQVPNLPSDTLRFGWVTWQQYVPVSKWNNPTFFGLSQKISIPAASELRRCHDKENGTHYSCWGRYHQVRLDFLKNFIPDLFKEKYNIFLLFLI